KVCSEGDAHDFVDTVLEPTCTAAGYTWHTCQRCHYQYQINPQGALGHDYQPVDSSPSPDLMLYRCTRCHDSYYVENGNRNYLHEIAIGLTSAAYDTNLIIRIYNDSIDALDIRDVMDTICPDTPQFDEDGVLIYNPNNALIGCGGEVILNTNPTPKFNVLYAIGRRVASQKQFSILVYYDWFGTGKNTSHYFIMRDDHIDDQIMLTDTVTQVLA
ncbi:MAG: hypothetical protein NC133_02885, partial [Prevotella sp.]|nr:hypothetical protein [Prevotella sp.]